MMTLTQMAHRIGKVMSDNSPAILTAVGVTGTITTAVLVGRATIKAAELLSDEEEARFLRSNPSMEARDKVELTWQLYIPAVTTGILTCVCIIGANRIGSKRAAAMTAAYTLSERAFTEYQNKAIEKMGAPKEQAMRDELAQERFDRAQAQRDPAKPLPGKGSTLCYDTFSGRTFMSDMETLRKAQNDINFQILTSEYATVSDFYDIVGLDETSISSEVGWNHYKKLELKFSAVLDEYDNPCMAFDFTTIPIRDPWNYDTSMSEFRN